MKTKLIIIGLAILLLMTTAYGLTWDHDKYMRNRSWVGSGNTTFDPLYRFMKEVDDLIDGDSTVVTFDTNPVTAMITGGAAIGTTGSENCFTVNGNNFEYHVVGTQTILGPSLLHTSTVTGLNITQDETDNDGVEYTQGILAGSRHAYTVGTDACYVKAQLYVTDVSGTDALLVGFRKAEAYQALEASYDELAALKLNAGTAYVFEILNGSSSTTSTTDTVADDGTVTLEVIVSAGGVVTFEIDDAAPTVTSAFTFDTGEVIVPFLYFRNSSDVAEETLLLSWECGKTN
jgi:hypothetical protein